MLTVVMPMGGYGTRFRSYTEVSKPLILINGLPMFIRSLSCLPLDQIRLVIFICAKGEAAQASEMYRQAGLQNYPHGLFLEEAEPTGVAHCVQLARHHIPHEDPQLLIHHSDQFLSWDKEEFVKAIDSESADGIVPLWMTTEKDDWGFAIPEQGTNWELRGIKPKRSSLDFPYALCGCSYFSDANFYFSALADMTEEDLVQNEIYVESAYNKMITRGHKVKGFPVKKVFSMGTPEEMVATIDSGIFNE